LSHYKKPTTARIRHYEWNRDKSSSSSDDSSEETESERGVYKATLHTKTMTQARIAHQLGRKTLRKRRRNKKDLERRKK